MSQQTSSQLSQLLQEDATPQSTLSYLQDTLIRLDYQDSTRELCRSQVQSCQALSRLFQFVYHHESRANRRLRKQLKRKLQFEGGASGLERPQKVRRREEPSPVSEQILGLLALEESSSSTTDVSSQEESDMNCENKLQQLQELMHRQMQLINTQRIPIQDQLEELYLQFYQENRRVIRVEVCDPLVRQILELDPPSPDQVQIFQKDARAEMEAARKGEQFPPLLFQNQNEELTIKIGGAKEAEGVQFPCLCQQRGERQSVFVDCQLCNNARQVGREEMHFILQENLKGIVTSEQFDEFWTKCQYPYVIWKLACYSQFFRLPALTFPSVLAALHKKVKQEFLSARKSFFQKVLEKDAKAGAHCVLIISQISKSKLKDQPNSLIFDLYDGQYAWKCFVSEKGDKFDCDKRIIEMVKAGQVKAGDKFHFFGLYLSRKRLPEVDRDEELAQSKNNFLSSRHNYYLKINFNGFSKALDETPLGEQEIPFFLKQTKDIIQYSKTIPCLDIFIARKHGVYYMEEQPGEKFKRIIRNHKAMERLKAQRKASLKEQFDREYEKVCHLPGSEFELEALKQRYQLQRQQQLDCFKMCFRVKAIDAMNMFASRLAPQRVTQIQFMRSSEAVYESIQVGQRYRLYNLKADAFKSMNSKYRNSECLYLSFNSCKSSFEDVVDRVRQIPEKRKQVQKMLDFGKRHSFSHIKLSSLIERLFRASSTKDQEGLSYIKQCNEVSFAGILLKVIENDQAKVMALVYTAQEELVSLHMHDLTFLPKACLLPLEGKRVVCDSVVFKQKEVYNLREQSNKLVPEKDYLLEEVGEGEVLQYLCATNASSQIECDNLRQFQGLQEDLKKLDEVVRGEKFKRMLEIVAIVLKNWNQKELAPVSERELVPEEERPLVLEVQEEPAKMDILVTQQGINRELEQVKRKVVVPKRKSTLADSIQRTQQQKVQEEKKQEEAKKKEEVKQKEQEEEVKKEEESDEVQSEDEQKKKVADAGKESSCEDVDEDNHNQSTMISIPWVMDKPRSKRKEVVVEVEAEEPFNFDKQHQIQEVKNLNDQLLNFKLGFVQEEREEIVEIRAPPRPKRERHSQRSSRRNATRKKDKMSEFYFFD